MIGVILCTLGLMVLPYIGKYIALYVQGRDDRGRYKAVRSFKKVKKVRTTKTTKVRRKILVNNYTGTSYYINA